MLLPRGGRCCPASLRLMVELDEQPVEASSELGGRAVLPPVLDRNLEHFSNADRPGVRGFGDRVTLRMRSAPPGSSTPSPTNRKYPIPQARVLFWKIDTSLSAAAVSSHFGPAPGARVLPAQNPGHSSPTPPVEPMCSSFGQVLLCR